MTEWVGLETAIIDLATVWGKVCNIGSFVSGQVYSNSENPMSEDSAGLDAVEFATIVERRAPCVVLIDNSSTMMGKEIDEVNDKLQVLGRQLREETTARHRVELAVATFGRSPCIVADFTTPEHFNPPTLSAQGHATMGAGINKALDMLEERKVIYRDRCVPHWRPWVILITCGQTGSTEVLTQAVSRVRKAEADRRVSFFTFCCRRR